MKKPKSIVRFYEELGRVVAVELKPNYLNYEQTLGNPLVRTKMLLLFGMHPDEVKEQQRLHWYIRELNDRVPLFMAKIHLTLNENHNSYRWLVFKECMSVKLEPELANRTPDTLPALLTFDAIYVEVASHMGNVKVAVMQDGVYKSVPASQLFKN